MTVAAGSSARLLSSVSCPTVSDCEAVGEVQCSGDDYTTLVERWNGSRWSVASMADPGGQQKSRLFGVTCVSASSCLAVGTSQGALVEVWNGRSWSQALAASASGSGMYTQLSGVACVAGARCLAVGYEGSLNGSVGIGEIWTGGDEPGHLGQHLTVRCVDAAGIPRPELLGLLAGDDGLDPVRRDARCPRRAARSRGRRGR